MPSQNPEWCVKDRCINCMASRTMAPAFIKEHAGKSVFLRQPSTPAEVEAAWRASAVCPVGAVEAPAGLEMPERLFPQYLGDATYRLGFNAKSSYGSHSYFALCDGQRFMVDAPRWNAALVDWLTDMGGLNHILLTHRDDVADAKIYADHFGARVWIHEADAASAPFATDIMRGNAPDGPAPSIKVLFVPGHTAGSVMYLMNKRTLFTGDSLAWDSNAVTLRAYEEYCWFDWKLQLASLGQLRNHEFSRIFAGHGESVDLTTIEMQEALSRLLETLTR